MTNLIRNKIWAIVILVGLLHVFVLSRLQFTVWPEVLSFPYMIDKGFLIYKDFHHVYQPLLTYLLFFFYKIFGFSVLNLKIFTWIIIFVIDILIFLLINKVTKNQKYALLGVIIFSLLQPIFEGNMLWFDLAVTPFILLSLYFLFAYVKEEKLTRSLFLSGSFFGIAFLVKQQAILVLFPTLVYLMLIKTDIKKYLYFFSGTLSIIIPVIVLLYLNGLFFDYVFWTFTFPVFHLPKIDGYAIYPNPTELKVLFLLALGLIVGFLSSFKKLDRDFYLLLSILFFLFLSAFPRFSFLHLQPFLALYVVVLTFLLKGSSKLFLVFLLPILILWKGQFLTKGFEDRFNSSKDVYLASKISQISNNKKIYLLGPNSLMYVFSGLIPPKPWIENYVWHFEIPKVQEKVIEGWEKDPPAYIFWSTPQTGNYYELGVYQPKLITQYIVENYDKINEIDPGIWTWKLKDK